MLQISPRKRGHSEIEIETSTSNASASKKIEQSKVGDLLQPRGNTLGEVVAHLDAKVGINFHELSDKDIR